MKAKRAATKAKTPAQRAIVLHWQRAVRDLAPADLDPARPAPAAILAVSLLRVTYADPDGRGCRPARGTLAREAGLKATTVAAVDRWLEEQGLLAPVRKLRDNITEYRLTLPRGTEPPEEVAPREAKPGGEVAPLVAPLVTPLEANNLLPPERSEGGGGGVAAPQGAHAPEPSLCAQRVVREAIEKSGQRLEVERVAVALDAFRKQRAGRVTLEQWPDQVIVDLIATKATEAKSNPTVYVEGALRRPLSELKLKPWYPFAVTWEVAYSASGWVTELAEVAQRLGLLSKSQQRRLAGGNYGPLENWRSEAEELGHEIEDEDYDIAWDSLKRPARDWIEKRITEARPRLATDLLALWTIAAKHASTAGWEAFRPDREALPGLLTEMVDTALLTEAQRLELLTLAELNTSPDTDATEPDDSLP